MQTVFIIHGVEGHPEENWLPWLKKELEKQKFKVIIPKFPTPEGQTLKNWLKVLEPYKALLKDSIVIGHSLGVPFLLNILEKHEAREAYLVAGYCALTDKSIFYEGVKTFIKTPFDFKKIKENCKNLHVFHSDNDPYFPLELGEELANKLGVKVTLVKGAGHFNSKAGYDKFELLLNKIKKKEHLSSLQKRIKKSHL